MCQEGEGEGGGREALERFWVGFHGFLRVSKDGFPLCVSVRKSGFSRLEEFSLGFYKLVLAVQTADRSGEERPNFSTNPSEISMDLEAVGLGFFSRLGTLCSPVELSGQ